MNTLKSVFSKIAEDKTELAKHEVNLALADDLKEIISEANRIIDLQQDGVKWGNKAEKQYNEVKKVISDAEGITRGAIRQAANLKTNSDKTFNNIEKAAKELGLNANEVKGYAEAIKLTNKMFENQNELNGWNEFLKKLL